MTKLERQLLEIIKRSAWGQTPEEIVSIFYKEHLEPAFLMLSIENKIESANSPKKGRLIRPVIREEKFL